MRCCGLDGLAKVCWRDGGKSLGQDYGGNLKGCDWIRLRWSPFNGSFHSEICQEIPAIKFDEASCRNPY
ncbi:hypothetical protein STPYR_12590 [uncultured Stenotrophomonas sp.]|uniref:Uncharacterized protein n=1 Tax=uncultured Stenotrophomonas sp. TaxID=165438 RepID=A0A1Y5QB54_9GAMM|nr:hypothetical protein STPYR_12590 [uncultured Stenotrophomonas sp.]